MPVYFISIKTVSYIGNHMITLIRYAGGCNNVRHFYKLIRSTVVNSNSQIEFILFI